MEQTKKGIDESSEKKSFLGERSIYIVAIAILLLVHFCTGKKEQTPTTQPLNNSALLRKNDSLSHLSDSLQRRVYTGIKWQWVAADRANENAALVKRNAQLLDSISKLNNRKVDLQVKDVIDGDGNPAKFIEGIIVPGENYDGTSTLTLSLPRIQIGDSVRFGFYSSLDGGIPKLISPDFSLYKQQTVALGEYIGFEQPGYKKIASCFDLTIAERNRKVYPVFINEYHKDAQKIKKGNRQFIAAKVLDLASMLVMNKLFFSEPLLSISANGLDAHDPNNRFAPANAASDKKLTNRYIAVGGAWLLWGGSKGLETAARNNYLNAVTSVTREISFSVDF